MNTALFIIVLIVIFILGVFVIPQFMIRRAIRSVIKIFQQHNAIGAKSARTIEELGLQPKSMLRRLMKTRDYKPQALQILIRSDIVRMTEEGKVYLSEESLTTTKWQGR